MAPQERAFGWRSEHDPLSLAFPVRAALGAVSRRYRLWRPGPVLDQGTEGACVGFGWTAELLASPRPVRLGDPHRYASGLYRAAQQMDEWPGEDYEGTSVIAGARALVDRDLIGEYRWAFGIDDVIDAVVEVGPVVIGVEWREGMLETRPGGLVHVVGRIIGGHCLTLIGYNPHMRIVGERGRFEVFKWRNSWGVGYGRNGSGYVTVEGLEALLAHTGEACVPLARRSANIP